MKGSYHIQQKIQELTSIDESPISSPRPSPTKELLVTENETINFPLNPSSPNFPLFDCGNNTITAVLHGFQETMKAVQQQLINQQKQQEQFQNQQQEDMMAFQQQTLDKVLQLINPPPTTSSDTPTIIYEEINYPTNNVTTKKTNKKNKSKTTTTTTAPVTKKAAVKVATTVEVDTVSAEAIAERNQLLHKQ